VQGLRHGDAFKGKGVEPGQQCVVKGDGYGKEIDSGTFERRLSMGGLAVLTLIGLYIFAGYKFVKTFKPGYHKWLAIAALVLIPTADAIVGRIYLQHLCATESGLKVYRVAQGVEGFIGAWGSEPDAMPVEKFGYYFSEGMPMNGRVKRFSKKNGQPMMENDALTKSKFRVRLTRDAETGTIFPRTVVRVETFPIGEVLAADIQLGFSGGWAERFLGGFSDAGVGVVAQCKAEDSIVRYEKLILSTLKR
jgi:hypothetical protein